MLPQIFFFYKNIFVQLNHSPLVLLVIIPYFVLSKSIPWLLLTSALPCMLLPFKIRAFTVFLVPLVLYAQIIQFAISTHPALRPLFGSAANSTPLSLEILSICGFSASLPFLRYWNSEVLFLIKLTIIRPGHTWQ